MLAISRVWCALARVYKPPSGARQGRLDASLESVRWWETASCPSQREHASSLSDARSRALLCTNGILSGDNVRVQSGATELSPTEAAVELNVSLEIGRAAKASAMWRYQVRARPDTQALVCLDGPAPCIST